jgi:hypothetical protein
MLSSIIQRSEVYDSVQSQASPSQADKILTSTLSKHLPLRDRRGRNKRYHTGVIP